MIPRQLVNQPAVNRTQAEFPVCSTFLSFFSAVSKQPRHLCSRKISRKLQTRRLADLLCVPLLRNLLRNAACAAALPYNCLFQRFPGRLVPDRRRLTLIADADSGEFTYFFLAPDISAETYHIEFRYGSDAEALSQYDAGEYAYWVASGISTDCDQTMIDNCIELFCTENLAG